MNPPKVERFVAPPIGITWTTVQKNSGSYGSGQTQITTTRGERMWQGQMAMTTERSQTATLWSIYVRAAKHPAEAGSQETELISVSIKK